MILDTRGTSIIETLTATVVIAVGVLGIALLTGGLVRGNRQSDRMGSASLAVGSRMDALMAGSPLNAAADLAPGPHPADSGGPRFEALDATGNVVASSVPLGAGGHDLLRRWVVTAETSARCLRRVEVSVVDPRSGEPLATAETLVNCP